MSYDLLHPQSPQKPFHNSTGLEHYQSEELEECTERIVGKLIRRADESDSVPFFVGKGPLPLRENSVSSVLTQFHYISQDLREMPYGCDPMQPTLAVIRRRIATMTVVLPDYLQKYMKRQAEKVGLQVEALKPSRNIASKKRSRRRRTW